MAQQLQQALGLLTAMQEANLHDYFHSGLRGGLWRWDVLVKCMEELDVYLVYAVTFDVGIAHAAAISACQ